MNLNPQVSVIVVSFNTRDLLLECLDSIVTSASGSEIEIFVVDNASEDGSYEAVLEKFPEATAVRNPANVGFGAACNQAIRNTCAPLVLLLNSDARINSSALQALLDCMSDSHCAAAGCRLTGPDGENLVNTRNFLTPFNQALEYLGSDRFFKSRRLTRTYKPRPGAQKIDCSVDWIEGSCLMLRRSALDRVGLFDERFFMYSEDEDLCFRLRQSGFRICYSTAVSAMHRGGASTARDRFRMLREFYSSQVRFLEKHRGPAAVSCYLLALKIALRLKLLTAKGRIDEYAMRLEAVRAASTSHRKPARAS